MTQKWIAPQTPVKRRWQVAIEQTLLRAVCWLSAHAPGAPPMTARYWTRVLGGPIRGAALTLPRLERLSYAMGTYEPHVVNALQQHVRPGGVAYDVGAHIGYITLALSRMVGPTGQVVAFEADPHNRAFLNENTTSNGTRNVTIVPTAVSDGIGTITFATFATYSSVSHIAHQGTPSDAQLVEVPCTSLDAFVYDEGHAAPNCIKIDVEGAEDSVVRGALRTLREHRPVLVIEVRADQTWEAIRRLLLDLDYRYVVLGKEASATPHGVADVLFEPQG